jgi:hypothetical protein
MFQRASGSLSEAAIVHEHAQSAQSEYARDVSDELRLLRVADVAFDFLRCPQTKRNISAGT